jgi:hypothetical protein
VVGDQPPRTFKHKTIAGRFKANGICLSEQHRTWSAHHHTGIHTFGCLRHHGLSRVKQKATQFPSGGFLIPRCAARFA